MQHDLAEGGVATVVWQVVKRHLAGGLDIPEFAGQQSQNEIHIGALPQEHGQHAFLHRRQQASGEFLALDRHDGDGGVVRHAAAKRRNDHAAGIPGQGGRTAGAEAEIEGGRDVGDSGEMNGLMMPGAGDIQQQLLRQQVGGHPVVTHDRQIQDRR